MLAPALAVIAPGEYRHWSVMGTVAHMKEGSRERHWAQLVPSREQLYSVTEGEMKHIFCCLGMFLSG